MRNAARDEKAIQAELAGNLFFGATGLTRRQFVTGGAAAAGALALAACGGTSDADTATDAGSGEAADVKKVLNFAQTNAKKGFDEAKVNDQLSYSIGDLIGEAPCMFDEDLVEKPCFLTKMPEVSEDGLTYSLELKDKIPCHDGSNLTAKDVKWSLEREMWPETAFVSLYMINFIEGAQDVIDGNTRDCSGIQVQDDTHLTIKLTFKYPTFMSILGSNFTVCYPQSAFEAAGDSWGQGTNIVGSGPYKVVSNDDTTEVVLEKFADYHDGEPALDEVHYVFYDDNNTKLMAFKNGDIDYCDLDAALLQQYQNDPDVSPLIHQYLPLGTQFINLNLKDDMGLTDQRVRQALSLAINRQELIDTALNGAGQAASGFLNPAEPGFDESAPAFEYDPEKAKSLIAEAGADGLSLVCKVRKGVYETYMTIVQSYWDQIGVKLDVQVEDSGVWASDWADGNLQITALGWFPLFADADNHMYTYFYSENATKKSSFYNNPEFDDLMAKARVSTDQDERADLYKQADDILSRQDYGVLPLYYPKQQFVCKDYVLNAKVGNLIYHMIDVDIDTTKEDYVGE